MSEIIQTLKDLNIDDNTMIVFTSDNGPSRESYLRTNLHPDYYESFGPFDGIKRDTWEGGMRVGALVRWPAGIKSGRISEHPVQAHDWMTTFSQTAGLSAPARCDGVK